MTKARDIVSAIGRKEIRQALSVGETSISEALSKGKFPSGWYAIIKDLGEARDIEVPRELFNWRAPVSDHHNTA